MGNLSKKKYFEAAVKHLGGLTKCAKLLNMSKERLWYQINEMKSPIDISVCLKIQKLTNGKFNLKKLRPDLDIYLK